MAIRIYLHVAAVASLTFLGACSDFSKRIDRMAFESFGGTLLSSPREVTMKEIHLDNGKLLGREIIVEGKVVELGEHSTHVVVADDTARLLVVTTNLANAPEILDTKAKGFRVLGTVERGKKGLPYVLARAMTSTFPSEG